MCDVVNTRSYYIMVHDIILGYKVTILTTVLNLILIIIVINETRNAPLKPIITESVKFECFKHMCILKKKHFVGPFAVK